MNHAVGSHEIGFQYGLVVAHSGKRDGQWFIGSGSEGCS